MSRSVGSQSSGPSRLKEAGAEMQAVSMLTNLQPGENERSRSSHSFFPDNPIAPGHLKGDLLFQCDTIYWDTKLVDVLRYQRGFT